MKGGELQKVRDVLGHRWFGRPLYAAELGRALRLKAGDPGKTVREWEAFDSTLTGPVSAAIDTWLAGAPPPDPLDDIRKRGR